MTDLDHEEAARFVQREAGEAVRTFFAPLMGIYQAVSRASSPFRSAGRSGAYVGASKSIDSYRASEDHERA